MGPGGPGGSKYPSYPDAPFDQQQQQSQRPPWGGDRFSNRPNTPFSRPPNSWGGKDGAPPQRPPNRDPRVIDRDPRTRPEPPHQHKPATPPATKGPPPGKEVHPNKLKQQQAQEKDAGECNESGGVFFPKCIIIGYDNEYKLLNADDEYSRKLFSCNK